MPERTCVGCGAKAPQEALTRLRTEGERVTVDTKRSGGRGAWLHADAECLNKAVRRKSFARAFRRPVAWDVDALRRELTVGTRKD